MQNVELLGFCEEGVARLKLDAQVLGFVKRSCKGEIGCRIVRVCVEEVAREKLDCTSVRVCEEGLHY
jgi:hypothetical protein